MSSGMDSFLNIVKALSDSQRLRTLLLLRQGELCVCRITEFLNLAPSTVSKHMSVLRQAGLVKSRKDSRWVYFRLAQESGDELVSRCLDFLFSLEDEGLIDGQNKDFMKHIFGTRNVCKP